MMRKNTTRDSEKKGRHGMSDLWFLLAMVTAWLLITQVIFPRLGVPT